jgi:hypothetical protein
MKTISLFCFAMFLSLVVQAQMDIKFGFRAGGAVTSLLGPRETDATGSELEKYNFSAKLCVGGTVSLPFNDAIGLSAEVLFSQKGARYRFETDNSYLKLPSNGQTYSGHQRIVSYNLTNGYVEIPVLFYVQPIKERLQLDFGPSISFLVSSRALGILKYGVIDPDNPNTEDFLEMEFDHKYLKDEAGALATNSLDKVARLDQTSITYPSRLGSYYFFDEKQGPAFSNIDFGLNFGASLFFTKGLRVGARAYYGLVDITNNNYDVQQTNLDSNNEYIFREDKDINFGIQFFIGLQF